MIRRVCRRLVELSRHIDYLIDVRDSARMLDSSWRQKLIRELACSFGTLGGPQVEPPQHLAARPLVSADSAARQRTHVGAIHRGRPGMRVLLPHP